MASSGRRRTPEPEARIPPLDNFAQQFKAQLGRDMTPEERRFYELAEQVLRNPPEDEADGNAKAA